MKQICHFPLNMSSDEEPKVTVESQKRKTGDKKKTAKKPRKRSAKSEEKTANADDGEILPAANELYEPTPEELRQSEKVESTIAAVLTKRQKKRIKHQEKQEAKKDCSLEKERERNTEYLNKWKHQRSEWKYEKLRQISIQQSIFDVAKISTETWPTALEYMAGTQGAAKEKITKLAEDTIDQLDAQCEATETDEERQTILDSTMYQRARELLQALG